MRWMALVVLALLAAVPAQALSHEDGNDDVTVDVDNDTNEDDGQTQGAGRDDGGGDGDGIATPWAVLMVLGVLIVVGIVGALFFAARRRH